MPEKAYILILRAISDAEALDIAARQEKDEVVVYSVDNLDHQLNYEPIPTNIASDSSIDLLKQVVSAPHRTRWKDQMLNEALRMEGLYPHYVSRTQVFRGLIKPAFEIAVIDWLRRESENAPITVFSSSSKLQETQVAEDVTIDSKVGLQTKKAGQKQAFKYAIIFGLRSIMGFFQSFRAKKQQHVLGYTLVNEIPVFSLNGEMQMGDPVFGYLCDRVQKEDQFSLLLILKNFAGTDKYSIRKLFIHEMKTQNGLFFEYFMLRALFNSETRKNWKQYLHHCKVVFKDCIAKAEGLDKLILMAFSSEVEQFGLMYLRYRAANLYVKSIQPRVFGAGNEHSYTKYPIIGAAKENQVPTFGIQHGGISNQNAFYSFTEEDRAISPIPDFTFTWGSYVYDRLVTNSIYSEDGLIITGQMRADVIPVLNARKEEGTIGTKTVLFASQPLLHMPQARQRMFEDVFKLQKRNPNLNVIIKPHPREYKDSDYIKKIAEEQGVVAQIKTDDLYYLLSKSDVVVTYFSTAGAEAIYFDKELIVYDYDRTDIANYYALGVGHMCADYRELESTLKAIETGTQKDLSTQREAFRAARVYKIDGNSVQRTIDAMRDISNK